MNTHRQTLVGKVFGRLTVLEELLELPRSRRIFKVLCECGNIKSMLLTSIKNSGKRTGTRLSGCGACNPMIKHPKEYNAWINMKARCRNSKDYAGRGIKVCDEWLNDFYAFIFHIGSAPGPEYSVEREDNNKGYEPGNVVWATKTEQQNNRRYSCKEFTSTRL